MKPCDSRNGWREFNKLCWWVDFNPKTWEDAYETCNAMGGILPEITNPQLEQTYYYNLGKLTGWIGLNDQKTLGQWVWALRNGDTVNVSLLVIGKNPIL